MEQNYVSHNRLLLHTFLIRIFLKNKLHTFALLTALWVLVISFPIHAQTINSPQLRCMAVDSVGDVTLTWVLPSNLNANFVSYQIFTSNNKSGPYTQCANITVSAQNSYTVNGANANTISVFYYIITNSGGLSTPLDTLETIFLSVANPGNGMADLSWNAMHVPLQSASTRLYKIYREYPTYVWTLIDTTRSLFYNDTIFYPFCTPTPLNYRVEIADSSGCTSVSNRHGGTFEDKLVPTQPVLDTVSVTSAGGVNIAWTKSPTRDVEGYIIYGWINNVRVPIDTVWGQNNLNFFLNTHKADSSSEDFWVAAFDSCRHTGAYCNEQSTIYLTQSPDSCEHINTLSWTPFINLLPQVGHYKVYRNFNGGAFTIIGQTHAGISTFTDHNLGIIGTYSYYVQVTDSNSPSVTASSNKISYAVRLLPLPLFSYLQTATVINTSTMIQVNAFVDTEAHAQHYVLQRAKSAAGPFKFAGETSSVSPFISFIDDTANPNNQSYYYQVISQNQCGFNIDTTQISQTIYLSTSGNDSGTNLLIWNDYSQWFNGVSYYEIFRNEDGGPFAQITTVPFTGAGANRYVDNITSIIQGQGQFSYYIEAVETPSPYPFVDTGTSNTADAYQDPRLYIPNAFSPFGKNNIFIPVGVFVNLQNYDMSIFDRQGEQLFETNDFNQGWNGQVRGGKVAPLGVYVYHLQYTSSRGEYFERNGTVTLIR